MHNVFRPKNCLLIMAAYGTFPITEFIIERNQARLEWFFDASAEYKGESLNKHLLQGLDHTNSLMGVLC